MTRNLSSRYPVFDEVPCPEPVTSELVRTSWEKNAAAWTSARRAPGRSVLETDYGRAAVSMLGNVAGLRLLDAGCGEGSFCRFLAERGAVVTGIDIAPSMIALAQSHRPASNDLTYIAGDISELNLQAGAFDAVIALMSLKDMPDLHQAIATIAGVLRPSGQLVFAIYHPCFAAPGASWYRRESGNGAEWIFDPGDYLHERVVCERWRPKGALEPLPAPLFHFHRTLATYLAVLHENDFTDLQLTEIPGLPRDAPSHLHGRVPMYLVVSGRRTR